MTWKAIGKSVAGTSHVASGKICDDAVQFSVMRKDCAGEALVCCASDGAGSALYAAWAADFVTHFMVRALDDLTASGDPITESDVLGIAEDVYAALSEEADLQRVPLNEYSCTLLGCCLTAGQSVFFQIGDGAIVRNDGAGNYTYIWWPQNGEYQNTTSFIVDDPSLGNLNITILDERVDEVAIFTDGLQLLALNTETSSVHQPFFTSLFHVLRMAGDTEKQELLTGRLTEYLNSKAINDRTDDDKTLFLATRL